MRLGGMKLDKNIKSFVKTLNKISGVYPASSCGGHKETGDPKWGRMPEYGFFVIMKIRNKKFLKQLQKLVTLYNTKHSRPVAEVDYHPVYKTWRLSGLISLKEEVFEPWAEEYLKTMMEYKPENQWQKFYSYQEEPPMEE